MQKQNSIWDTTIHTLLFGFSSGLGYAITARLFNHYMHGGKWRQYDSLINYHSFTYKPTYIIETFQSLHKRTILHMKLSLNGLEGVKKYMYGIFAIPMLMSIMKGDDENTRMNADSTQLGPTWNAVIPLYLTWFLSGSCDDDQDVTIDSKNTDERTMEMDTDDESHSKQRIQEVPVCFDKNTIQNKRPRSDSNLSDFTTLSAVGHSDGGNSIHDDSNSITYLEMLVHNVSHTDLVLSLGCLDDGFVKSGQAPVSSSKREQEHLLARPRFSAFHSFCNRILSVLKQAEKEKHSEYLLDSIMCFPRYHRCESTPRFSIVSQPPSEQNNVAVGLNLQQIESELRRGQEQSDICKNNPTKRNSTLSLSIEDMQNMRVRGKDMSKVDSITKAASTTTESIEEVSNEWIDTSKVLQFNAVFFPLLSSLMRKFRQQIEEKYNIRKNVKSVVILVSGVGTPRNWTHSIDGNSTEACAELMEIFIKALYPEVTVVRVHSETEIFRYDENIRFAKNSLMPTIDEYRDAHARGEKYPDEKGSGNKNSSFTRPFNPDWKDTFSVTLSFADGASARTYAIQTAMRAYRPTYFHFWQLKTFWHETKICDDDIEVHSFEHMSVRPAIEVEKADPDIQMVVEEMKQFRVDFLATLRKGENDIRRFWLRKTQKPVLAVLLVASPTEGLVLYRGTNMEVSMPTGSLCAERNVIGTALASMPGLRREDIKMVAVLALPLPKGETGPSTPVSGSNLPLNSDFVVIPAEPTKSLEIREPVRRIRLYDGDVGTSSMSRDEKSSTPKRKKRAVLVHSTKDLNPLLPCGACNEWLKKISESNPSFRVVTFTDANCSGLYCAPCQE